MKWILVVLLPLLGVGCATTALINATADPLAVDDHLGPIEKAYRTASNELVVCMAENYPGSQFNRQCRLQFPLGRCESATNSVLVPRRFLHKKPSAKGLDLATAIPVPVSPEAISLGELMPTEHEYLRGTPRHVTLDTIYNIRDPDSGIFKFAYGSTTTTNLLVFQLTVRSQNMRPLLLLLPVTAAVDSAIVPLWVWLLSQGESDGCDLRVTKKKTRVLIPPRNERSPYFDGD